MTKIIPEEKRCPKCKTVKPASGFYRSKYNGLSSYCKVCESAQRRKRYQLNREHEQAVNKVWMAEHRLQWNASVRNLREKKKGARLPVAVEARCSKCGITKPASEFGANPINNSGLTSWCRDCNSAWYSQYYEINKERILLQNRLNELENPDKARERKKKWRDDNPDAVQEMQRRYYAQHRARELEDHKKWVRANLERLALYNEQWRASPGGKVAVARANHKRRMSVLASPNTLTTDEWMRIVENQGGRCASCGLEFSDSMPATMDHIVPVSVGGGLVRDNVQALCGPCNSSKGAKTIDFRQQLTGRQECQLQA